jgi:hypothetical protein
MVWPKMMPVSNFSSYMFFSYCCFIILGFNSNNDNPGVPPGRNSGHSTNHRDKVLPDNANSSNSTPHNSDRIFFDQVDEAHSATRKIIEEGEALLHHLQANDDRDNISGQKRKEPDPKSLFDIMNSRK